jgi:hypothetical protein
MELAVAASSFAPIIDSLSANPNPVGSNGQATLSCVAYNSNGNPLNYIWSVTGGTISGSGATVNWSAPAAGGTYSASCTVSETGGSPVSQGILVTVGQAGISASIAPLTGLANSTGFTVTGSGASPNGQVTASITLPDNTIASATTAASSSGSFTFGPFVESKPGTYTEVDSDSTGKQSGVLVWTVTPTGIINLSPGNWTPVFNVGDSSATLGLSIANQQGGSLTGTITASTSTGGSWLTVNGHGSDNWVAPVTENMTATPSGLAAGTYNGSFTVTSPNPVQTLTVPVTMTIYSPLQITTSALPDAVSGQAYTFQLLATGGTGTGIVWSENGTLPLGLSFNPSTGTISGTAGPLSGSTTETLTFTVQDSIGHSSTKTLTLLWREGLVILPLSPSNFQFVVGSSGNSITIQAEGGTTPYAWSATNMPSGLSVAAASGVISGTPTQPGTFTATFTVIDAKGQSTTAPVVLVVVITPLVVVDSSNHTPPNLPNGIVGSAYSQVLNARGGSESGYTWSVQGGLPPGVSSSNSSGCPTACGLQLSGAPTQAGTYTLAVTVTDSLKETTQQGVTIVIDTSNPPHITTTTLPLATIGLPYSFPFSATGGTGVYQWSTIGKGPDPRIQMSSEGLLSGTSSVTNDCPTGPALWLGAGQTTYFQVQVIDSAGQSSVLEFCLPAYYITPKLTSLSPPAVTVDGQNHTITVNGTGFTTGAYVSDGAIVPTTYVSSNAVTFRLTPVIGAAFSTGGPLLGEGNSQFWIVQPYSYSSNTGGISIYDPVPTISNATAVLNNSTEPCTTNLNCQLIVNGGGLVYVTSYMIQETGQNLVVADSPNTPIPWNTITSSAFSVPTAGTYTIVVTNQNQPNGGSATAVAAFTVSQ